MTVKSVEDGAEGIDYDVHCPICGKKRGNHCQNKISFAECPNKNEKCSNKDGSNFRIGCKGSSLGYQGYGSCLGSNILTATYNIPKEAKSPTANSIKDRIKKQKDGTSIDCEAVDKGSHPLYVGQNTIQAHHLITSEIMKDEDEKWVNICKIAGYNINCKLNGIFLPSDMRLACLLNMQRHAGSHYMGRGEIPAEDQKYVMSYVNAVREKLNLILSGFSNKTNERCKPDNTKKLLGKMNALSRDVCTYIEEFEWTIAWDSSNYAPEGKVSPRIGCANEKSILGKKKKLLEALGDELKSKDLVPKSATQAKDWKSKNFDDMDTIQLLVEEKPGSICCTSHQKHIEEFAFILNSKVKEFNFEVGY